MIKQFDVGGIPALFTPTDGPLHAGLAFRVGTVDEPLSRRGITHLIEHLALHSLGVADYHFNGATGEEITYFHSQGSEADVVGFLNGVCQTLHNLPLHRMPTEKEILRTEQSGRGVSADDPLAVYRHGALGYGLRGYPELGLTAITPDDLRRWAGFYFTRGNCALWIAGPAVPAGLRPILPPGQWRPVPAESSALPDRPAFFTGPQGVVAWNAVVRRSPAAEVFPGVLQRAMFRSLRQEGGLSYTMQADCQPRGREKALISAVADALPAKQSAVLGGFVDVLAALRFGGVDPAEVTAVVNQSREQLGQAARRGALLPGQVGDLLTGRPVQDLDELVTLAGAVTAAEVHAVALAAYADGLLMAPSGARADWTGFAPAPTTSTRAVTGTAYPAFEDPAVRVVVGDTGVSIADDECSRSVPFDACAVLLAYPDGGRTLIGHDAITVSIEPTLFDGVAAAVPYIDSRIHPDMRIDLPARDPAEIPQPPAPAEEDAEDDGEYCCDDDCCANSCNDGECCNDVFNCKGECCAQCCDDDCCPRDCCDYECCSDGDCAGKCCKGVRGALRRFRR